VTRESSTIYLGGARGDVELLELGVLLRLGLVREGAVRAVPAPELLHHRLRNRTRPRARRGRHHQSPATTPASDGDRISWACGRSEPAAGSDGGDLGKEGRCGVRRAHLLLPGDLLPELGGLLPDGLHWAPPSPAPRPTESETEASRGEI
jgi:hypothetical protein